MSINKKKFFKLVFLILLTLTKNSFAENSLYELYGNKVVYINDSAIIIAEGKAYAKDQFGKEIFSEKIIYNKKDANITTESKSIYRDNKGNELFADYFFYNLNSKIISAQNNVIYQNQDGNKFNFTDLVYNENTEVGIGNNLKGFLADKSSIEGIKAEFDNKKGILTIGKSKEENIFEKFFNVFNKNSNTYTPCEIKDRSINTIEERCPDWSLTTQQTVHDKNQNMVYHYGSLLRIKNIPIFYTPYFSHPDPTVKRKSGFLPPTLKNFNDLGRTIKTPYYWVVDDNKDLTFSPIYYFDEKPIFLTEYNQQNKQSKFYIDASYSEGYKRLKLNDTNDSPIYRTPGSRNHLFFNFLGNYDDLLFSKNDFTVNVQRVSQKNYLLVNQINTQYIKQDITALNNNIILNSYENNKKISVSGNIYENLTDDNNNSKYQYTLPTVNYSNFFNKFNQQINQTNTFEIKNTGGDSNQGLINNIISTTSDTKILPNYGISSIFKTSLNNYNYYNKNISGQKQNLTNDIYIISGVENSYPLMKISENNEQTIIPKIFSKFTTGSMSQTAFQNKVISYSDIYSMNRSNSITKPETGANVGYGVEYNLTNFNSEKTAYSGSNFSIGQVLRLEKKNGANDLSTLSDTRSGFVGTANYFYDESKKNNKKISSLNLDDTNFNIQYDYILSKNLNKILKNQIESSLNINNNTFTSNYYETHDVGNEHHLELKYKKKINDYNFLFGTKKNIQDNYTEYNYIEANYESDCLKVSLNFSKNYYQNEEIRPSQTLRFTIEFKPFGNPVSPDLSNLLK